MLRNRFAGGHFVKEKRRGRESALQRQPTDISTGWSPWAAVAEHVDVQWRRELSAWSPTFGHWLWAVVISERAWCPSCPIESSAVSGVYRSFWSIIIYIISLRLFWKCTPSILCSYRDFTSSFVHICLFREDVLRACTTMLGSVDMVSPK